MNCHETVTVNANAVNWLKEKYPELCIKAGLCERVAGRLYTKTFTTPPAAQPAPVQEPVAWMQDSIELYVQDRPSAYYTIPLYTTPPAAQPAKEKAPQSANCEAPGRISSDHTRDTNYKADQPVAVVSGYYGGQCVILPTDPARLFNSGTAFYTTPPAAQRQWVGTVDCIGLALDLEAQAKRVESQTVERAMLAAANGFRIIYKESNT